MVCSKLNKKSRMLLLRQVPTHPLSPHLTMQLRVTLDLMFLSPLLGYEIIDMYQQHIQFVLRTELQAFHMPGSTAPNERDPQSQHQGFNQHLQHKPKFCVHTDPVASVKGNPFSGAAMARTTHFSPTSSSPRVHANH